MLSTSTALAQILALYCIIMGAFLVLYPQRYQQFVRDFLDTPSMIELAGIFVMILGCIGVVLHTQWEMSWRGLLTFFMYLTLLKGITLVYCPAYIRFVIKWYDSNAKMRMAGLLAVALGAFFGYYGFA